MHLRGAIPYGTRGRRTGILASKIAAILSATVVILYAFGTDPPVGNSGAPGEGTCASCHGTLTAGSGVTVAMPSMTYTPGGAAVSWTVTIPQTGGFELSTRAQTGNGQAGVLTAGSGTDIATSGAIQYIRSATESTSWTVQWTPPATGVGNVAVYVTGGSRNTNYSNSYVLTPASTSPGSLSVTPSTLTFTSSGAAPPAQTLQVTSGGSPIAFTTSSTTTSGGSWLSATPTGGTTPMSVSVTANPTGLAAGTYMGSVTVTSTAAPSRLTNRRSYI